MEAYKVLVKFKRYNDSEQELEEIVVVMSDGENMDNLVQMAFPLVQIIGYTYAYIKTYVSKKYCHEVAINHLKTISI